MRRARRTAPGLGRLRRVLLTTVLATVVVTSLAGAGVAHASERWLDVNISEQVLSEVVDGHVVYATHISSGNGEWYWDQGEWWLAETPRGWFQIYAKVPGWDEASLGWLYNAMYFVGGFAIHGSEEVPDYPASHGCVRVSLGDADYLFETTEIGTWVFVHD
jgi:lipoprotein-anchoring transpeptidase ErfK/SrfK